jgi:hypothetical protein
MEEKRKKDSIVKRVLSSFTKRSSAFERAETEEARNEAEKKRIYVRKVSGNENAVLHHNKITTFIQRMEDYIPLTIEPETYPAILVGKYSKPCFDSDGIIYLPDTLVRSGTFIGEEAAHFLRYNVTNVRELPLDERIRQLIPFRKNVFTHRKIQDDSQVQEFFGYLGRRIMRKIAVDDEDDLWFHSEKPISLCYQEERLCELKKLTEQYKNNPKRTKKQEEYTYLIESQEAIRRHLMPYYFAQDINIDEINLKELFLMTDNQIKRKYFKTSPKHLTYSEPASLLRRSG